MNDCLKPLHDEVEKLQNTVVKHNAKVLLLIISNTVNRCIMLRYYYAKIEQAKQRIALVKSQIHELKAIFNEYDRN